MDRFASNGLDPEQAASNSETRRLLEALIDGLPQGNRAVFVLRDVEGMSTAEASEALGITEENVKVRLHRARAALKHQLSSCAQQETRHAFAFHAVRCDRVVKKVFEQIQPSVRDVGSRPTVWADMSNPTTQNEGEYGQSSLPRNHF